jgi:hypothetical protein
MSGMSAADPTVRLRFCPGLPLGIFLLNQQSGAKEATTLREAKGTG